MAKIVPGRPPSGVSFEMKRAPSLESIHYDDKAVEVEAVGGRPIEFDEETKWIRGHMKRRECCRFSEKVDPDPQKLPPLREPGKPPRALPDQQQALCQCGYQRQEHISDSRRKSGSRTKWNIKEHTKSMMSNAFGEVEFVGFGGNVSKYCRVDVEETKMKDMLEMMMKVWRMTKPNLLISVTGGAKNFQMNKRLKETFRRGLMKAAQSTGAWIITGGTHAGVMKHVGEAVKDYGLTAASQNPVVTIGIAPWGCIQNKDVLINKDCEGHWPAGYRIEKEQKPKESFLDPNHSHFILADNGMQHKFAVEIPFRAKLENEISKMRTDTGDGDNAVSVPIVLLVLEGGPGTLETVHQAIVNNTPAVIVQGSGRAADILAYAYHNATEEDIEALDHDGKKHRKTCLVMDSSLEVEVKQMVEKEFGKSDTPVHIGRIKDCLNKCDLMSIFEHNKSGSQDIDVAMLKALLKANKNQVMDQLKLALAWNRIDVAKSEIFTDEKRWPTGSLDEVMFTAIQLNRVDFVELFLDHGVSLREFLTKKRLVMLYNRMPPNSLLRILLKKVRLKHSPTQKYFSLRDVGLMIQQLIGDYFRPSYTTYAEYADIDVDFMMDGTAPRPGIQGGFLAMKQMSDMAMVPAKDTINTSGGKMNTYDFEYPSQELFLWSILMLRQDMSKMFWCDGKDAIAAALMGNSLLKALKAGTEDTELAIKIEAYAVEWCNLAIGVLNECHAVDEHKAQDLLVRELVSWGEATCMLIAVKADNKDFIAQTACQLLLNRIWMGRMSIENGILKLVISMLLPPLCLWLIKFRREEHGELKQPESQVNTNPHDNSKDEFSHPPPLQRRSTMMSVRANVNRSRTSLQSGVEEREPREDETIKMGKTVQSVTSRFYYFFNAPVTIFLYNVLAYLGFLSLYAYVLLFELEPEVSPAEILLIVWVFTIFTEEIRQVVTMTSNSLKTKILSYVTDTWNIVDMITILLFIVGLILRFLPYADTFEAARVFLALNFVSFFWRLLHIFSVHKQLGPKLVMIGRMVQDLLYFVVILMVFVVSYAIASHSILFPNSPLSLDTIISVIRRSYWNIYGELFLDEIEGAADCTFEVALWMNGTYSRCPTEVGKYVVPIMMGVYMLLANVLLLNLLIAMFSYTFTMIQDNTDVHWCYQRYSLIYEYYTRPILAPPFIVFSHVYILVNFIIKYCCCRGGRCIRNDKEETEEDDFRHKFPNERELVQWENVIADAFHHKRELQVFDSTEFRVKTTSQRIDMLINRLDEIQEQQNTQMSNNSQQQQQQQSSIDDTNLRAMLSPSAVHVKMPPEMDKRLADLEKHMESSLQSIGWIVQALQTQGAGASDPAPHLPNIQQEKEAALELAKKKKKEKSIQEKRIVHKMLQDRQTVHYRSRTSPYPGTQLARFSVPDDKVPWEVHFEEYEPITYTAQCVKDCPIWADTQDLMILSLEERLSAITTFNEVDTMANISRISYLGHYAVNQGLPYNTRGRTGLQGRGALGRWGPNLATDPVVTRWKMEGGEKVLEDGKPVLEFAAVMRSDNEMWALPGAILLPGRKPIDHLQAEFTEEALGSLMQEKEARFIRKKIKRLWKKGEMIYQGYADDPRNTDNAWLETVVYSYHDNDNSILPHFTLRAGDTVDLATWMTATSSLAMHGSHSYFLKLVADKLGAAF